MGENFKIHLQGTADTKQWAAANGLLGKLTQSGHKFVESIRAGVGIDLGGKLVNSLASLPGVFTDILKGGFDFNVALHDSEIAIANVTQKFMGLNAEAAKDVASKAMAKIIELEPKAAGTLQDLTSGFIASLASAQAAGVSIEENIELVGLFANGLANASIPAEQLVQEMRAVFSGNLTPDAAFGKGVLALENADIARAKEAGNLYQMLKDRIGSLGVAGDSASVAMSSLSSAIGKAQGILAKPLFERVVQGAKDFAGALDNPEVIKTLTAIGVEIGAIVDTGTDLAKWAVANAEGLRTLFHWSKEAFVSLTGLRSVLAVMDMVSKQAPETPKAPASSGPAEALPTTPGAAPTASATSSPASSATTAITTATKATDDFKTSLEKARSATGDQAAQLRVLQAEYDAMVKTLDAASPAALAGLSGDNLVKAVASDPESSKWSAELLDTLKQAAEKAAQIKALKGEIDEASVQANEESRNAAVSEAKANAEAKDQATKLELAREAEKTEVAITAAKAAGQDVVAKQLEDQTRINELARKYRDELKMTDADALSLAQTKVQSERSIADQNSADTGGGSATDLDTLIARAQRSKRRGGGYENGLADRYASGSIIDRMKRGDLGSPLTDQSPLTPGGGLANFKRSENGIQSAGSGNSGTLNLGPNKAAQTAKEAADGMGRVVTAVTQRDAALAGELSRLKSQVATLETRIADNARQIASNRT